MRLLSRAFPKVNYIQWLLQTIKSNYWLYKFYKSLGLYFNTNFDATELSKKKSP